MRPELLYSTARTSQVTRSPDDAAEASSVAIEHARGAYWPYLCRKEDEWVASLLTFSSESAFECRVRSSPAADSFLP